MWKSQKSDIQHSPLSSPSAPLPAFLMPVSEALLPLPCSVPPACPVGLGSRQPSQRQAGVVSGGIFLPGCLCLSSALRGVEPLRAGGLPPPFPLLHLWRACTPAFYITNIISHSGRLLGSSACPPPTFWCSLVVPLQCLSPAPSRFPRLWFASGEGRFARMAMIMWRYVNQRGGC